MEDMERMKDLWRQGFFCSQILMTLGLEMRGETNPELIRAMHGLSGGLGFSGELCGALTGGGALLGVYAGKGTLEEEEDLRLFFMTQDLVKWFKEEFNEQFGGIRCEEILAGDGRNQARRCPVVMAGVFQKVKDLLIENGFELSGSGE